jgi:hypothetical protein
VEQKPKIADVVQYDEFGLCHLAIPEQRLIGAIIQRAVLDYGSKSWADRHARKSAIRFLFSDDPEKSHLRFYAELVFRDPDAFIANLRRAVKEETIKPIKVAITE